MKINWKLFPMKMHYLFRYLGMGPLGPFLPVISRQKGVNMQIIGFIWTVLPFTSLITKTCAGAVADRYRAHRVVFLSALMVMIGTYVGVYLTPDIDKNGSQSVHETEDKELLLVNETRADLLLNNTQEDIRVDLLLNNTHEESHVEAKAIGMSTEAILTSYWFWILFLFLFGNYSSHISSTTMQETVCFSLLGDDSHKYGEQRLYGTLGWGVGAVTGGALVDWYSRDLVQHDYTPAYLMALAFLVLDLFIVARIKFSISKDKLNPKTVGGLFKKPAVLLILVSTVLVGASCGMISTFQLILVEDVAHKWQEDFAHTKLLQGLQIFVQCVLSEMPILYITGHIIAKIGHFYTFFISHLAFFLRLSLYATVTNPFWFLPIEALHGVSFGFGYASALSFASIITPKGAEATTQAIFGAAYFGGSGFGGLVGGWLLNIMPNWKAFLTAGIINGIYAFIFLALYFLISRYGNRDTLQGHRKANHREASQEEVVKLQEASQEEVAKLQEASQEEVAKLPDASQEEVVKLQEPSQKEVTKLQEASQEELAKLQEIKSKV